MNPQRPTRSRGRASNSFSKPRKLSVITDFPAELLAVIFRYVFEDAPPFQPEKDIIPSWMNLEGKDGFNRAVKALANPAPTHIDPKSPTLFPYSLASVCSFWRSVLSSCPEYWTLVVLFVDSSPTSLADASLFLQLSKDYPIDVVITRREHLRCVSHPDHQESRQIKEFLHVIEPHLHRCRSLHIDSHLNSSLPLVYKTFKGEFPNFKTLELVSDTQDFSDNGNDDEIKDESKPELRRLVVDGRNFRRTAEGKYDWMNSDQRLNQITIANYKPSPNNTYTLKEAREFLKSFFSLDQLKLQSLHLNIAPGKIIDKTLLYARYLHLEDLREDRMVDFDRCIEFVYLSVLWITRCPLPKIDIFSRVPRTLILEDISPEVDLVGAVSAWSGKNLWLDRCPSFSDAFLEALASPIVPNTLQFPCQGMRSLLLYRLPKFSVSSLKTLIENRNKGVSDWRDLSRCGPAISHVAVVRCGVGELSAADKEWFQSRLFEFHWIP